MRLRLASAIGLIAAAACMNGCGGGGSPQPPVAKTAEKPEKADAKQKADSAKKVKEPARSDSKAEAKADTKADTKEKATKAPPAPNLANARPGTVTFLGDEKLVSMAEKTIASSTIFVKAMSLRRSGKKPPLLVKVAVQEGLTKKFLDDLAAGGVDVKTLQDPKVIREMAKEGGTAVVLLTVEATEGVGKDGKPLDSETWEVEAPVAGDTAEARTVKALDDAYKAASDKAKTEILIAAMDSLAMSLLQVEGSGASDSLDQLALLANDPNERIKKKAAEICALIKTATHDQALSAIKSENKDIRKKAAQELLSRDLTPEDLNLAIELLKDPEYEIRSMAALVVVEKKPDTDGLAAVLCETLGDRNSKTWNAAQAGLEKLGGSTAPLIVPKLTDRASAKQAQKTLEALSEKDPNVVVEMAKALSGNDPELKLTVLSILGRIGPNARPAITQLIEVLSGTDKKERTMAASALGRIGLEAEIALPALEKAAEDGIRAAFDARRAILLAMRKAGKEAPASASYSEKKPDKTAPTESVAPPPPQIIKQKILVLKDGTEVKVESFMKMGGEYKVKTSDGESKTYPEGDIKEVKVVEVKEGEGAKP